MAPPLLILQDIQLTLGSQKLLNGVELSVGRGDKICLVGRNGCGKSTLLKVAAGSLPADHGSYFLQPGTTLRVLAQEPDLSAFSDTRSYVESGLGPGDDPHRAIALLHQLGLHGDEDPARLSGGEIRRVALAQALASGPDLLLLDEPTNHLDLPAIEWLEQELRQYRGGLVLISHDRRLLESLASTVVWLDAGITRRMEQGFAQFESWRDSVLQNEEREHHKLGRQIAREEDWMRYGVTARRKRNMRRVHELSALRDRFRQERRQSTTLKGGATEADSSGKLVAVAEHISKSYDGRTVVRDLSLRVLRGDRLGIIGPNGAGKTTLLRMLTGTLTPDAGQVTVGNSVHATTLDQQRQTLNPTATLADTLTGGGDQVEVAGQKRHVIGYMKDFLFRPEQARTPLAMLSGGERGRLMLALAFAKPSNFLILDEPTNDLDLETLDLLQEQLTDYKGTVLLVSHDRDFLDRVATSVLLAEGDGRWTEYAGGYSDMLAQRGPEKGAAQQPKTTAKESAPRDTGRRKMSFKDKHALETLPARMAALQVDIHKYQGILADPALYARDSAKFAKFSAALAQTEADLAAAEEQWLELEMLRESLGG